MRAWYGIGADDFPAMAADDLAKFLEAESIRAHASLTEDARYAENVARVAKKIGNLFGGVAVELPDMPPVRAVPSIDDIRAMGGAFTAEFWTEFQETPKAAAWVLEHHPSAAFAGVPFDMLPEEAKQRAMAIAVEALYDREIARRIARQLPPLPDVGMFTGEAQPTGDTLH